MTMFAYARASCLDPHLGPQLEQLMTAGCDEIFQDKISGAKDDRPEFQRMMAGVVRGDCVVVCKIDRIARSTANLLEIVEALEKKGATFKVHNINLDTGTPSGKLMMAMVGTIATFEHELVLESQRGGIERAKDAGKYKGRFPSAKNQSERVLQLLEGGMSRQSVAVEMGIGISSVYRILKASRINVKLAREESAETHERGIGYEEKSSRPEAN